MSNIPWMKIKNSPEWVSFDYKYRVVEMTNGTFSAKFMGYFIGKNFDSPDEARKFCETHKSDEQ